MPDGCHKSLPRPECHRNRQEPTKTALSGGAAGFEGRKRTGRSCAPGPTIPSQKVGVDPDSATPRGTQRSTEQLRPMAILSVGLLFLAQQSETIKLNLPLALGQIGDVTSFEIAEASQRVVYLADQQTDELSELYSAPLAGGAVVKLSTGQEVFQYQVISGGLEVVYCDGLGIFRASLTVPGQRETLFPFSNAPVNRGEFLISRNEQVLVAPDPLGYVIFSIDVAASRGPIFLTTAEFFDFTTFAAMSPRLTANGDRLVISTDVDGIRSFATDGTHAATLASGYAHDIALSPDDTIAVIQSSGPYNICSASIDGSGQAVDLAASYSPADIKISPDSTWIVYRGDLAFNSPKELYSVPISGGQAPTKISGTLASATEPVGSDFFISSDSLLVVHRARLQGDGQPEAYTVGIAGGVPNNISGHTYWVNSIKLSPSDVVVGEVPGSSGCLVGATQLYSMLLSGGAPPVRLTQYLCNSTDMEYEFTPDGQDVIYRTPGDRDLLNTSEYQEIYLVPSDGSAPPAKISGPLDPRPATGYASSWGAISSGQYRLTSDKSLVVYIANQGAQNADDAFMNGVDALKVYDLYASPTSMPAGAVKLNAAPLCQATLGDVRSFQLSPDKEWIVYAADGETDGVFELYSLKADRSLPVRKISGVMGDDNTVYLSNANQQNDPNWKITPDGSTVLFWVRSIGWGLNAGWGLYSAPVDGSSPPIQYCASIATSSECQMVVSPQSDWVVAAAGFDGSVLISARLGSPGYNILSTSLTAPGRPRCKFYITSDGQRVVYYSWAGRFISQSLDGTSIIHSALSSYCDELLYDGQSGRAAWRGQVALHSFYPDVAGGAPVNLTPPGVTVPYLLAIADDSSGVPSVLFSGQGSVFDHYIAPMDGSMPARHISNNYAQGGGLASVSKDGRWLAFIERRSFSQYAVCISERGDPSRTIWTSSSPITEINGFAGAPSRLLFRDGASKLLYSALAARTSLPVVVPETSREINDGYVIFGEANMAIDIESTYPVAGIQHGLYAVAVDGSYAPRELAHAIAFKGPLKWEIKFGPGDSALFLSHHESIFAPVQTTQLYLGRNLKSRRGPVRR